MIINTNSWHYQLLDKLLLHPESNKHLCGYFWKLVFGIFLATTLITLFTGVFFGAVFGVIYSIISVSAITYYLIFESIWNLPGQIRIASIFGVILILSSLFLILKSYKEKEVNKFTEEVKLNILVQYIVAVYSKVCPLIEFKNK